MAKDVRGLQGRLLGSTLALLLIAATVTTGSQDAFPPPGAGAREVLPRTPRYPLKTARMLRTDAEIAQARANVERFPSARRVRDRLVAAADPWLAWEDDDLARLVTPASVPRAFDVSATKGCPKCGNTIHERFGTYPWLVDLKKPFKLTCPVDGSVYPSNDYETYLRSGFREKRGWDTAYVDDGWGWKSPEGERLWFVAHYNHRVWHQHLGPGIQTLARAYQLTGDRRYAHKAAVLLAQVATVYPAMDHERQSRYGLMQAARGIRYPGKVLNHIWEAALVVELAEAYDAVWETLDGDAALQKRLGKSGPEIRAHVEADLIEDAIDAYFDEKVRGNFGMHQSALAHLALARQQGENEKWLDGLLDRTGASELHTGLRYALYNLLTRDGVPYEGSPGYNFIWVSRLSELARVLKKADRDLYAIPRVRSLIDGPLEIVNIRKFTPSLGDTASVYGGLTGGNADVYQAAFRQYGDPRYARLLATIRAAGDMGFQTYESLFLPPVGDAEPTLPPQASRLLDGYGMGILNDPADSVSLALTYGRKAGHGHYDRLSFEIFAAGQSVMPDLGYPDAMNDFVSGIYTWSKNTVAHNTVVVDASRQSGNVQGTVRLFAAVPFARVLDVDAAGTYPQAKTYRRALFMVDTGGPEATNRSYVLDVFDVAGGRQHDYSLHGPPGEFALQGGDWSAPAPGTLAGEQVKVGELYDAPEMAQSGYSGGYSRYTGSGFQHLFNVRRHRQGEWFAEYRHEKDPAARLRLRVFPQQGQELLLAEARVSPVRFPQLLRYLIARRAGENVASRFVSVLEPYRETPLIETVEPRSLASGEGVALAVRRADGATDFLLYDATQSRKRLPNPELTTDAQAALVTRDREGRVTRVFFTGGTYLRAGGREYRASALRGRVTAVDPEKRSLRVRLDSVRKDLDPAALAGRVAFFENDAHRAAHPLAAARLEGGELALTTRDDLLVGRAHLIRAVGNCLETDTPLPLGLLYPGTALCDPGFTTFLPIEAVQETTIHLRSPLPAGAKVAAGRDCWLVNVRPGDRFELSAVFSQRD